jgi:isopentenyl-diphosphate delta-isomerase type 1
LLLNGKTARWKSLFNSGRRRNGKRAYPNIMDAEPKQKYVDETRSLINEIRKTSKPQEILICGESFVIEPGVFSPKLFFSTAWFADEVSKIIKDAHSFLEMGCGTGVISCVVSLRNPNIVVDATDISPGAANNTRLNVKNHNLSEKITVYQGDVFDGLKDAGLKFDYIFWAMPFGYVAPNEKIDMLETTVFDPGYRAITKFFQEAKEYLRPGGKLLIGFSNDIGHYDLLDSLAKDSGFMLQLLRETAGVEKDIVKMEIYEALSAMEMLDILDEQGEKTGKVRSYEDAHQFGLVHRAVHVWIINSRNEILIQKRQKNRRAYPSHWDISSAGHVSAGETSLPAARREVKEELGLDFSDADFQFLCTLEEHITLNEGTYVNNEFDDVFVVHVHTPTADIKIDPDEVDQIRWITIPDFEKWTQDGGEPMVPHKEEYERLLKHLQSV